MHRRIWQLGHGCVVVAAFGVFFLAFFAPALLRGDLLGDGDSESYFWPLYHAPRTAWTPLLFSGFPLIGDPQTLWRYPVAIVWSWLPGSWNGLVLSAYVMAGCFTYGWLRRLTGSSTAAAAGGLTFATCGFLMAHLGHTNMIHAACWAPLALWSLEELRLRTTPQWIAAAGLALGMNLLAGHPQIFVYTAGLAGAYTLVFGWSAPGGRWRFWGAGLLAFAFGVGLGAVLLLPGFELSGESVRRDPSFDFFAFYSKPARDLPGLLFPFIHGGFPTRWGAEGMPYFGRASLAEATGYVGLTPILLAAVGFAATRRMLVGRFWLTVAVLALLACLGKEGVIARLLYFVPGYGLFRVQARHFLEFSLAVSALAALGLAELLHLEVGARRVAIRRASRALAALVGLAYVSFLLVYWLGPHRRLMAEVGLESLDLLPWTNPAIGIPLAILGTALVVLVWWGKKPSRPRTALLLGVLAVDVGSFGWLFQPSMTRDAFAFPSSLAPVVDELRQGDQRLVALPLDGPRGTAPVNRSIYWGVPTASGYNPLTLERYARLLGIGARSLELMGDAFHDESLVLDVLAVRTLVMPQVLPEDDARTREVHGLVSQSQRWRARGDFGEATAYENLRALPRAWLVNDVRRLAPEEILAALQRGQLPDGSALDPKRTALVEREVALEGSGPVAEATALVEVASGSELVVECRSPSPAFLVLSDAYYPGWVAFVNDVRTPVHRTHYALRGVAVPAGTSRVRMVFEPRSARLGAAGSAVAALALMALLAGALLRRSATRVRGSRSRKPVRGEWH